MANSATIFGPDGFYHRVLRETRGKKETADGRHGRSSLCFCIRPLEIVAMNEAIQWLDVVALSSPLPEHRLMRRQVGTVVEVLAPDVFEVESSDDAGGTYAMLPLRGEQLIVLHTSPVQINCSLCSAALGGREPFPPPERPALSREGLIIALVCDRRGRFVGRQNLSRNDTERSKCGIRVTDG